MTGQERSRAKGPKFIRYFDPVIQALKELGGSGRTSEVIELVATRENVPEAEQQEVLASGGLRFDTQVQFARQYLVWAGYIDGSIRGVWSLTEAGWKTAPIDHNAALELFKREHSAHTRKLQSGTPPVDSTEEAEKRVEANEVTPGVGPLAHGEKVLARLRGLSPTGFEHFCVRLLREHGFEGLTRTGGPRDKGVDGIGTLRINPFVSFTIVFQCKRYAADSAVSSSEISSFRGSIPNSVDKGIFITSSEFTANARTIARDTDKKPIELISGNDIVGLMENLSLGLRPAFELDETFFAEFEDGGK